MTEAAEDRPKAPSPRANPHLEGHPRAEAALAEAAASGRLHHAWLVSGPRGVGKATLAFRFARHLLHGEAPQPGLFGAGAAPGAASLHVDPNDPVFRRVASGGHADLFTLERGFDDKGQRRRTEIVIGDVRRVTEFLSLTAVEGGWRVVVVDGAEDMNRNAANALLKTLEEPPSRAVLLLVSHAPGRLPATIRSRCRKLPLGPLPEAAVAALVGRYRPDLPAEDVRALAAIGEGSAGRALMLAEAGGLALYGELVKLLADLPGLDAARLHGTAEALARTRNEEGAYEAYDVFTDLTAAWLARFVRERAAGAEPAGIVPGEADLAQRLAARADLDQWVEVWEKITRLFGRAARLNLDRKEVILDAFFALARTAA